MNIFSLLLLIRKHSLIFDKNRQLEYFQDNIITHKLKHKNYGKPNYNLYGIET